MAIRQKTIKYTFLQHTASLASATDLNLSPFEIFIPEKTSRVFRSVSLDVSARDTVTTATNLTTWALNIKLGSAAVSGFAVTGTITNSGEQISYFLTKNLTNYFNTNFGTATSSAATASVRFIGPSVGNIAANLTLTYDWDDTNQFQRVKTVHIPLDSNIGAISTTMTLVGNNAQIPALESFLPENNKLYRDIWLEQWVNEGTTATTDASGTLSIDSGTTMAAKPDLIHENGLNSACWYRRILKFQPTTFLTGTAHALSGAASTGMSMDHAAYILGVTYEYNHSGSTTVINSLRIPFSFKNPFVAAANSTESKTLRQKDFWVQETDISLVQSGILLSYLNDANSTLNVKCGNQTSRAYTDANALFCGGLHLMRRFDSGAIGGAGLTLNRGKNTITVELSSSSTTIRPSAIGAMMYLNYTSSIHALGDGVHNKTLEWCLFESTGSSLVTITSSINMLTEDKNYFLSATPGYIGCSYGTSINRNFAINTKRLSNEVGGDGWEVLEDMTGRSDNEIGPMIWISGAPDTFLDFTNHYDLSLISLSASRTWSLPSPENVICSGQLLINAHYITYAVSGSISGYTGDGSGIIVSLYESGSNQVKFAVTSSIGGAFAGTWFDNTAKLYAVARQDATHLGRSDDALAT